MRRSKRVVAVTDGYKLQYNESVGPVTRSKAKLCNSKTAAAKAKPEKILLPDLISDVEFPGSVDIEKLNGEIYLEISASKLQIIATGRCGINPSEVTPELLVDTKAQVEEDSSQQCQVVIHGSV